MLKKLQNSATILLGFLLFLNMFLPVSYKRVFSESQRYYKIVGENNYAFLDKECTDIIFTLYDTYYVKIIEEYENSYLIETGSTFATLQVYVLKDALSKNPEEVEFPYFNVYLTTNTSCVLYEDKSLAVNLNYIFKNRSLHYFGYLKSDKDLLYFVGYGEKLGYVKESAIMPFYIPPHPNSIIESETLNTSTANTTTAKLIIIFCLLGAGIVGIFLSFFPKRKAVQNDEYYDDY